jgi:hypothetical protein
LVLTPLTSNPRAFRRPRRAERSATGWDPFRRFAQKAAICGFLVGAAEAAADLFAML